MKHLLLLLFLTACCPKTSEITKTDTLYVDRIVQDTVLLEENTSLRLWGDSLMSALLNFKKDTVRISVPLMEKRQGGMTIRATLEKDSLNRVIMNLEAQMDTLINDTDSIREKTIYITKTIYPKYCNIYTFLKGVFGHTLRDILAVIGVIAIILFFIWLFMTLRIKLPY